MRSALGPKKTPNSSVLNLNGINVTLSLNLSHVSVSWKASLMQWSSSPSCRARAQWFNVTCLLLWATGQIEINRLNAKTVLKIMIDKLWILNFKKLVWFSGSTYILRVPYSLPPRSSYPSSPKTVHRALLSEQKRKSFLTTADQTDRLESSLL